ncbi:GNAT family N-acetyltransferase [Kitasatospora sp. NBC_01287]|uniref:GNAT family N-acetyltransferase n=1 Tax=Kitasatospora sp. NBC_01287 TaxID=2903573 RepID=UPI0022522E50|nr:GNAT family N-acetyltransferase [Kitasatospora sp. NBC_01287]MCX4744096.1 GNAT family N-acetyltransferase [Kitasatospora sp. NBC_01287]
MSIGQDEAVIRPAVAADIPGVVDCSAALFAEDAGTRDPAGVNIDWPRTHGAERFAGTIADPTRLLLVAEADGEVVAHLAGVLAAASAMKPLASATLLSMYVRPAHRRRAVGARLVAAFRDWAKRQGAARIAVTAYAANDGAIRFYERHGFTPNSVSLEQEL